VTLKTWLGVRQGHG